MRCRNCGTEIADKAIVCYKCGTATTEPTYKPPAVGGRQRRSSISLILTLIAVLIIGGIAVYIARTPDAANSTSLRYVLIGLAIVIVALRGFFRRMKR